MNNFDPKNLNVVFAGCARNCEPFIKKTLDNIEHYSSLFKESFKVIIENGSKDKTRDILKKNKKENDFYFFEDNLNDLPNRGLRLEKARNFFIEKIKSNNELKNCNLLIVLDLDESGNYTINKDAIAKSIKLLRFCFTSEIRISRFSILSIALFMSNFEILFILISVNLIISSSFTFLFKLLVNGEIPFFIAVKTPSQLSSFSISRYILFSIKILSNEKLCH